MTKSKFFYHSKQLLPLGWRGEILINIQERIRNPRSHCTYAYKTFEAIRKTEFPNAPPIVSTWVTDRFYSPFAHEILAKKRNKIGFLYEVRPLSEPWPASLNEDIFARGKNHYRYVYRRDPKKASEIDQALKRAARNFWENKRTGSMSTQLFLIEKGVEILNLASIIAS